MKKVKKNVLSKDILHRLIFTNRCRLCMKVIPLADTLCEDCKTEKLRVPENFFSTKTYSQKSFDNLTSPFYYDSHIRQGIHNLKYNNYSKCGEFLSMEMAEVMERDFADEGPDFITCVPMSKKRKREKDFNQCEILIKHIGKVYGYKPIPNLLIKSKHTPTQVNLKYKERLTNLKGAFEVNKKYDVKNKTVLICDDVITTGSTLNECSRTLKKAGAKRVICVTAAINHNDT